ncbi:MAG TPA: RibD family protein [Candidatus Saccharimonadia bacterium]|nr:RibD family protein [Candidatus Saccharimonadia bacterium]
MKLAANFVMTVDGKVQGPGADYWPIGSAADLAQLLDLRAQCDVLVHGRLTAMSHDHLGRLRSPEFGAALARYEHAGPYVYVVVSAHPDEALLAQVDPKGAVLRVIVATTEEAQLPSVPAGVEVWRQGSGQVDLPALHDRMAAEGWRAGALEAGPRLFGAWVAAGLVDDLYVTVAPKLFGTSFGTPTMINGVLFAPDEVPELELLDHRAEGDEVYLHYRFVKGRA